MTNQQYLTTRIRTWMQLRNKTPADMAKLMGVSVPTWYRKMAHPERLTMMELEMLERKMKIQIFMKGE